MTEEEKARLIAEGKLDENGNPIETNKDGLAPETKPEDKKEEPKFTQAELNAIIADRLAREKTAREKAEADAKAEAERKRLEENSEFKSLADQYKAELEQLKEDARLAQLDSKKTALLLKAGYNEEQIGRYSKFVVGETDDEIQAAVEQLKADVPPKGTYVDPATGNSARQTPQPKDKESKGRELFQKLKAQGQIRPR